ncbi:hypothetical protein BKA63DRAFT_599519 [Paraphoma chrysanthemicola]|nr:hypothetical protein BKA63DRAFT_599519 [Paraphoma chrysanthemicola]
MAHLVIHIDMRLLHFSIVLTLFPQGIPACAAEPWKPKPGARFGVTFSPTIITASRLNTSENVELMGFPASSEYQMYYQSVAGGLQTSPYTPDVSNVASIFRDAMGPVTESLSKTLEHQPEHAALLLPSVFDTATTTAATKAIVHDVPYATRTGPSRFAMCYGYGVLERQVFGEQGYKKKVQGFAQEFIYQQVLPGRKRENIRAVIITGEASAARVAEVAAAAVRTIGTKEVRALTNFKPSEVVAYGAAVWARMAQEHPEYFEALAAT